MTNLTIQEVNRIFECDILTAGRKQNNVSGRIAIANHFRSTTAFKLADIGRILNKDHATISHYLKIHDIYYKYDSDYRKKYDRLRKPKVIKREFCCYVAFEFNRITNNNK